jgi:hypothetical protein
MMTTYLTSMTDLKNRQTVTIVTEGRGLKAYLLDNQLQMEQSQKHKEIFRSSWQIQQYTTYTVNTDVKEKNQNQLQQVIQNRIHQILKLPL